MWQNEILEEIHRIREERAKSFNYDLDAMFAFWRKQQAESGREVVAQPAKRRTKSLLYILLRCSSRVRSAHLTIVKTDN